MAKKKKDVLATVGSAAAISALTAGVLGAAGLGLGTAILAGNKRPQRPPGVPERKGKLNIRGQRGGLEGVGIPRETFGGRPSPFERLQRAYEHKDLSLLSLQWPEQQTAIQRAPYLTIAGMRAANDLRSLQWRAKASTGAVQEALLTPTSIFNGVIRDPAADVKKVIFDDRLKKHH